MPSRDRRCRSHCQTRSDPTVRMTHLESLRREDDRPLAAGAPAGGIVESALLGRRNQRMTPEESDAWSGLPLR
jgi:hypothetical protein